MPALPTLFATQQASDLPLHEQLVRTLRSAMLAGHLPQHSRLPASRMLAADLGSPAARWSWPMAGWRQRAIWCARWGRQLRGAGRGLPDSAPAPVSGRSVTPRSGDGQQRRLSRRARGGPLLCFQPAGSPPLPQAQWGRLMQQQWRRHAGNWMNYGSRRGWRRCAAPSAAIWCSRAAWCASRTRS